MSGESSRHAGRVAALGLAIALVVGPALADRIYLDGGGIIETASWRYEGDSLVYENGAGTIGLPRSMVLKIEAAPLPPAEEAAASESPPADLPAVELVPVDLARRLDEARETLEARDFETAASLYARILAEADPGLQSPRIGYAMAHIALGRNEQALGILLDGLAHDPQQATLLELLGDVRDQREQVQDALRSWRDAFRHAPSERLREKILGAERELEAGRSYAFSATPHFNLRYDGQLDENLARAVSEFLEQQLWELSDRFRHTPPEPITVLLYPKRKFRNVTQTPEWVGGLYDGKIRVPLGGLSRLNPEARAVLVHELTHAVVHSKSRGQCPRWLHEGLAQIAENRTETRFDRAHVASLIAGIDAGQWESLGFSYPVALSLTRFLERRGGFHRLVELLERIGDGRSMDQALAAVYGADTSRLFRDWAEAVAGDAR